MLRSSGFFSALTVFLALSCAVQPLSEPIPAPVAEQIPESTPEPIAQPATEPTPEPVPEPVAAPITVQTAEPVPSPMPEPVPVPVFTFSSDSLSVSILVPAGADGGSVAINTISRTGFNPAKIRDLFPETSIDSIALQLAVAGGLFGYRLDSTRQEAGGLRYYFNVPVQTIAYLVTDRSVADTVWLPDPSIYPLFAKEKRLPARSVLDSLRLALPCPEFPVPDKAQMLPNAPRGYRFGVHRGIDFIASWGTPVQAVADGVVIRFERHYSNVSAAFFQELLNKTKTLKRTPSDIFEHILVGRTVYIDHGFDLVAGYRSVSIYAHLSDIPSSVVPGVRVRRGDIIGYSGNSGTEGASQGTRNGSHLHWELILQDESGEYYLGQELPPKDLIPLLKRIFSPQEKPTSPAVPG